MISPINKQHNNPSFKGPLEILTKGLELCDKYPMVGVSVVDGTTAIVPRTVIDAKTNGFAAAETFRRESMGLIVNCLMPSFAVLGLAKMVQPFTMGKKFKDVDMSGVWANEDTLNKLSGIYEKTSGTAENRIKQFTKGVISSLEGFNGDDAAARWKSFEGGAEKASDVLTNLILSNSTKKETKTALAEVFNNLAQGTKATEVIRFSGDSKPFTSNLSEVLRDTVDLGRRFKNKTVSDNLGEFVNKSTKLINRKSLIGMAVLIPLAMSVQFINRAITKWHSGQEGAPIYKDFGKEQPQQTVNIQKDKTNLGLNKALASAAMVGTTLLTSTGKFTKKMFQYKGLFPTLDQCRWIATATIVSRMLASDDNSELKEISIRDIATFLGLYALGDGVAKGTAAIIEKVKPGVKLLNKNISGRTPKSFMDKAVGWLKDTKLKSFAEVAPSAKSYRSICQLAHLGSSMLVLGLAIPRYVRSCTEKKEARMQEIARNHKAFTEQLKQMQSTGSFASFKAYYKKQA